MCCDWQKTNGANKCRIVGDSGIPLLDVGFADDFLIFATSAG